MLDIIEKRRACRKYLDKDVEDEKIQEIINAGLLAPSGMNRQTPVIIAIKDKELKKKLSDLNQKVAEFTFPGDPFYGANVIFLVIASKEGLSLHDGAATIENMLLEATNQGLGSCWIHRANEEIMNEEGRKLLAFTGLNFDDYIGIGHVIVGYADPSAEPREKVIRENRYFIK